MMMSVGIIGKSLGGMGQACGRGGVQSGLRMLGGCRTLFSGEALGVDGYQKQRERTTIQFSGMADKFRMKMKEFSESSSKSMVFTEDLKNMLHLVEDKNTDDLQLIIEMMKKFNQQNRHLRFGNFVFGPVVMRMYHFLNEPKSALEAFMDPALEDFFDQLMSYQILLDLLYKNQMYQEMLEVSEVIKRKQIQMTKFPRNCMILVFAALYKMNSVQSYEMALKLLTEMKEVGVDAVRRTLVFATALALNQNAPNVALEILSGIQQPNYVTVRNLKILALADLGRPDDAIPLLRYSLELDDSRGDARASVSADVMKRVTAAVEKMDNKEVTAEFQRVVKALQETGHLTENTVESFIEAEIKAAPQNFGGPGNNMQRQNMQRSFRIGRSIDMRPQRNPMFQREERSIRYE